MVPLIFFGVQDGNRVITVYALSRGEYKRGRPVQNTAKKWPIWHNEDFLFKCDKIDLSP